MTRSTIGIDLGSHSIKAVQLDGNGEIHASADLPRSEPGTPIDKTDIARLAGLLYRRGFSGSRIAVTAPKQIIHRLTIDLPPLDSGAPIDMIAQTELCRQRHLEPGSFEFTWYETPQPPRHASGARAMAVSCTHEDANGVLDLLENQGFDTIAIHSSATAAAAAGGQAGIPATYAVVDLGWSDATFIAVKNGQIRFVRTVAACGLGTLIGSEAWLGDSIGSAIRIAVRDGSSDGLNAPEFGSLFKRYAAAIATEVTSSIQYLEGCSGDESPTAIALIGGGAIIPSVESSLRAGTELPVIDLPGASDPTLAVAKALAAAETRPPRTQSKSTRRLQEVTA